jgi:hypothetical protein
MHVQVMLMSPAELIGRAQEMARHCERAWSTISCLICPQAPMLTSLRVYQAASLPQSLFTVITSSQWVSMSFQTSRRNISLRACRTLTPKVCMRSQLLNTTAFVLRQRSGSGPDLPPSSQASCPSPSRSAVDRLLRAPARPAFSVPRPHLVRRK